MSIAFIISISFIYLILLFLLAFIAERQAKRGKSWINNPYIYSLSLAVYCTAWTYYGSVGRAAESGVEFLTIYIGPTLVAPLWWLIMRKIIRICKIQHITTISDFISVRYGKSTTLGVIVTLVSIIGIIPYIALQVKAISNSFYTLVNHERILQLNSQLTQPLHDSAFYITMGLGIFTILFGTRNIETTDKHNGLITVIAFDSILKLVFFLIIGLFVSFYLFSDITEIFEQAFAKGILEPVMTLGVEENASTQWLYLSVLSMLAVMFLPRQFQVMVVENVKERHLNKAMWLFPLYLLLINIFVLPIALAGKILLTNNVDADLYVLVLPLNSGHETLALLAYIGGFAAATSMIVVSTIALSVMLSNNLIMPILVSIPYLKQITQDRWGNMLIFVRRLSILLILNMAYAYFRLVSEEMSLVSIGLISFVAIAQFVPAILGGVFWKRGAKLGAIVGIITGFIIWFYTLVLPTLAWSNLISDNFVKQGLWGVSWLKPHEFLGLTSLNPISQAFFWSMFFNISTYLLFSLIRKQSEKEHNQALIFVDIFKYSAVYESAVVWKGTAYIPDLETLLQNFLGKKRTQTFFDDFSEIYGNEWKTQPKADARLVENAEKLLAGTIGSASARIMISTVVKEEDITTAELVDILKESQQLISLNRKLHKKSYELEQATTELQEANIKLKEADQRKNDFISTVTHELKTPLTSIKAFSEILQDNPDLEEDEKQEFLSIIIKEVERMTRLILQVLDLERFESGKQKLNLAQIDLNEISQRAIKSLTHSMNEKQAKLITELSPNLPKIQADEDRMVQVIINLLSNAIKYCQAENGKIKIYSEYDKKIDVLRMSIENNGEIINPKLHNLIFEKFFQAEDQTIRKPKGSGLGLAICKKIIELHGGKIWIENKANGMTCFTFTLKINN